MNTFGIAHRRPDRPPEKLAPRPEVERRVREPSVVPNDLLAFDFFAVTP
jgi:hypothetical protein